MAKRFTDTNKWNNPWFRKLPSHFKALWLYLLDQCDTVGVIYYDLNLFSYYVGQKLTEEEFFKYFNEKVARIEEDKIWVTGFVSFQYETLSPKNRAHLGIMKKVLKLAAGLKVDEETEKLLGVFRGHMESVRGLETLKVKEEVKEEVKNSINTGEESSEIPTSILQLIKMQCGFPDEVIEEYRKKAWLSYQGSQKPNKNWTQFVANYFSNNQEKIRQTIQDKDQPPKTQNSGKSEAVAMGSRIYSDVLKAGMHGLKDYLANLNKTEKLALESFGMASEILRAQSEFEASAIKRRLKEACEQAIQNKQAG